MTRYIIIVGGVISGIGKGITTASIGKILKEYGYSVTAIKIDPYLNYDAGTLRPTEHGEVWVTDDGGEIDQDLGNYERFLDQDIPRKNNLTSGQVYKTVIEQERKGKFLGKTVQFIPHIPDEIKKRIRDAGNGYDFCLIEIGGTIGDYENIPFLFAVKSLERDIGKNNIIYVLVTYLPVPSNIGEMKTKPTQQAIRMLGENGIFPNFILCRSKTPLDSVRKEKIEKYANISPGSVISEPDVDTIYRVPVDLEENSLGIKILKEFGIAKEKQQILHEWKKLVSAIEFPQKKIKIALIGKYVKIGAYDLKDAYISVNEALKSAGAALNAKVEITLICSKSFEASNTGILSQYDGIIIPGGFGCSGVEGKLNAIEFARKNSKPFLGLCLGMQLAVIEFARNVCSMEKANSTEIDPYTEYPVIDILPDQEKLINNSDYGATMRLGAYAADLKPGSKVLSLYQKTKRLDQDKKRIQILTGQKSFRLGKLETENVILERHRHRYEVNPEFAEEIEKKGLVFSGAHTRNDSKKLMEFIEIPEHPFFIATQSHPEFKSRFESPSPLFYGFLEACIHAQSKQNL